MLARFGLFGVLNQDSKPSPDSNALKVEDLVKQTISPPFSTTPLDFLLDSTNHSMH